MYHSLRMTEAKPELIGLIYFIDCCTSVNTKAYVRVRDTYTINYKYLVF